MASALRRRKAARRARDRPGSPGTSGSWDWRWSRRSSPSHLARAASGARIVGRGRPDPDHVAGDRDAREQKGADQDAQDRAAWRCLSGTIVRNHLSHLQPFETGLSGEQQGSALSRATPDRRTRFLTSPSHDTTRDAQVARPGSNDGVFRCPKQAADRCRRRGAEGSRKRYWHEVSQDGQRIPLARSQAMFSPFSEPLGNL